MTDPDRDAPPLNYAGKDTLPVARPWYVILSACVLCLPACGATYLTGLWIQSMFSGTELFPAVASSTVLVLVVDAIAALPTVLAYKAIIRRSEGAAIVLCQLAMVPAVLLTFAAGPFIAYTREGKLAYLLIVGIPWFVVLSMRKWSQILGRAART